MVASKRYIFAEMLSGVLRVEWHNNGKPDRLAKEQRTDASRPRAAQKERRSGSGVLSVEVNEMESKRKHQTTRQSADSVKRQLQREFAPNTIEQLTNLNTFATLNKIESALGKNKRVVVAAIPSSKSAATWLMCFEPLEEEHSVQLLHCAPDYIDFMYALNSYFCI